MRYLLRIEDGTIFPWNETGAQQFHLFREVDAQTAAREIEKRARFVTQRKSESVMKEPEIIIPPDVDPDPGLKPIPGFIVPEPSVPGEDDMVF